MESLKHECGVALIKLRKPLSFYKEKYGTYLYGLNLLYLMMEKERNRGQEGAGVGCVYTHAKPGEEYIFRERALGSGALSEIFTKIRADITEALVRGVAPVDLPFVGELYMGHLRYSTTGKHGMGYVHPFLRRNNWPSRNLMLCGNFNMTNLDEIFDDIVSRGQHPRVKNDMVVLLEQLGESLDNENQRLHRIYRDQGIHEPELSVQMEDHLDFKRVLERPASTWDGGYTMCAITGSGDMVAFRDPNGIRPAFYYYDDEVFVVASERPVIQTAFNVPTDTIRQVPPGAALIITKNNEIKCEQILPAGDYAFCSFEHIYFSRGNDRDIYAERKALGRNLTGPILQAIDNDLDNTIFSFIPNTAEVAYMGMIEGLTSHLHQLKAEDIKRLDPSASDYEERLNKILGRHLRIEKIALKDIKLRTFITEGNQRNDLAAHVYDVTYGLVRDKVDNLVVIDDSIVRGTTLKQSIIRILDRLQPRRIVIVSSSPQVRFPDYYGIDMSRMTEFCAFRAAISLLRRRGMDQVIDTVYKLCKDQENLPKEQMVNHVTKIYEPFAEEEISEEIVRLVTPSDVQAEVKIVFQSLDGLHRSIPSAPGDWYFSGHYPTPGGNMMVNQAFINWYEGDPMKR